jgi:hypothetical protein
MYFVALRNLGGADFRISRSMLDNVWLDNHDGSGRGHAIISLVSAINSGQRMNARTKRGYDKASETVFQLLNIQGHISIQECHISFWHHSGVRRRYHAGYQSDRHSRLSERSLSQT